jgi:hypothetical protein
MVINLLKIINIDELWFPDDKILLQKNGNRSIIS